MKRYSTALIGLLLFAAVYLHVRRQVSYLAQHPAPVQPAYATKLAPAPPELKQYVMASWLK